MWVDFGIRLCLAILSVCCFIHIIQLFAYGLKNFRLIMNFILNYKKVEYHGKSDSVFNVYDLATLETKTSLIVIRYNMHDDTLFIGEYDEKYYNFAEHYIGLNRFMKSVVFYSSALPITVFEYKIDSIKIDLKYKFQTSKRKIITFDEFDSILSEKYPSFIRKRKIHNICSDL